MTTYYDGHSPYKKWCGDIFVINIIFIMSIEVRTDTVSI